MLPTWKTISDKTGTHIYDASCYQTNKDTDTYDLNVNLGFVSEVDNTQYTDLFYNTTQNIISMGKQGNAVDLVPYLDSMPNFKAFLDANPTIRKSIEVDGHIYYTPYFDGYNDVERMLIMDTQITKKVLDANDFTLFDTQTVNGGTNPSSNVVLSASYTPFIDSNYNYASNQKIDVLYNNQKYSISVNQTENIIKRQNELLQRGCTGKELAEQFRKYLDDAFGNYIGQGKVFTNYSDIFIGESAAYNSDELIALMRVVKANPGLITGDSLAEVEILFPRGQANNRIDNIADFLQIWGVQGMTSEKDMLYFDASGKLNDASTTKATYDGLKLLSAIYDEGLILNEFWYKLSPASGTYYFDKYFKKTHDSSGYGFMTYDYITTTSVANDEIDGIGTTNRKIDYSSKGIQPILPPLTFWATEAGWDHLQPLNNFTNKTLMRHMEENKTLKSISWCIPASSDNIEGAIKIMDYMFSEEGNNIIDFGPEEYWNGMSDTLVPGTKTPIFSNEFKKWFSTVSSIGVYNFLRQYIGAGYEIGHIRSYGLEIQATNAYSQLGISMLKKSITYGVVNLSMVDKSITTTWDTSVPTYGNTIVDVESRNLYADLTSFWSSNKLSTTPTGWVYIVQAKASDINNEMTVANDYTYAEVLEQMDIKNSTYLYSYAQSLGEQYIPEYAKTSN